MRLRKGEFLVELSFDEAFCLAQAIESELKNSIKTHYMRFDKETFFENERNRINMMEFFYGIVGRSDIVEFAMKEFDKMFDENINKGGDK